MSATDSSWSLYPLPGAAGLSPRPASGLVRAVWPLDLAQGDKAARLDIGDLALIDLAQPFTVAGDGDGKHGDLLDFGNRRIDPLLDGARRHLVRTMASAEPLAWTIGNLLSCLADLDRLGYRGEGTALVTVVAELVAMLAGGIDCGRTTLHGTTMLDRARTLIGAELANPTLRVSSVATSLQISTRHLSGLFAAQGSTVAQHIVDRRMERAALLLAEPAAARRQVASIARACGYEDAAHFSRAFKQHFGSSPRDYRNERNTSWKGHRRSTDGNLANPEAFHGPDGTGVRP